MCFPVPYAGFFAKSHIIFFLLLTFRFCSPLKNDGRGALHFSMVLHSCLSFLNEVMASEPFFEERSDAAKVSETPYPTNGSGKNPGIDCKR